MKLAKLALAIAVLGSIATTASAEPCGAVLCLSTNETAPEECKGHVDGYFSIRQYYQPCKKCGMAFDAGGTAAKRMREVMDQCKEAKQIDKDKVNAKYGTLERSPFDYTTTNKDGSSGGYAASSLTKVKETRYYTCAEAAQMPAYSGKISRPSAAALAVPDGASTSVGGMTVIAMGGYANWPLYDVDGQFVQYGFVVESRTITKTTGQGKVTETTPWAAEKTYSCSITIASDFTVPSSDDNSTTGSSS